jgi:uncharacterized protein YjbJ (UPF0337 family)
MMNSDELKGKWLEIKGEIAKKWGELTDNDLEKTKGNFGALVGLLQQKLGMKKEEASEHLKTIADRWSDTANTKIDEAKDKLKN